MKKITDFTKLFWANKGNHNELTSQKFLPECTFEEFEAAAGPPNWRPKWTRSKPRCSIRISSL